MANSKLLLSVDDLSHKLLSIETEVAVGETFDLILDGLAGVSTGSKVVVGLYSLSGGLLWTLDSPLSLIDDTHYGVADCTIKTQEAAKVVRLTSAVTILTLVIHAEDGKQTVYGSAYLRLHQGYAEDGESVGKAITSLEQHNADETAHPAIRKLVGELRNEVLRNVNETMLQHGNSEVEARNQAISHAIRQLDAELTNRYKGDLTFFATACAASSKAAAASAKVSAEASKQTVDKLGEANKVVEDLRDSLTEAGKKLENINKAIEEANSVASSLEESRNLIVDAKDTVVDTVDEFNATLKTFNDEFAQDKQTIKDSVTAATKAKDDFDAKWPTIEKVEGYAKNVSEAEGRITEAEGRVNTTVNEVLPAKVTEINASLDQKQTTILGNVDTKAQAVNTALDTKLATANTAINDAVEKAETAKTDAEKAQGEASKSASEASTSASNASKSATQAKTSENNAKTTADGLSAGLVTLNSFDGRVTKLETGNGAYRDPATGEMFFYEPLIESDGSIAVIKNNGVAWQIAPVEWAQKGGYYLSLCRAYSDGEYVYFFGASDDSTYADWLYVVYDRNLNRVSPILTCSEKTGGYGKSENSLGAFACFATDGYIFAMDKATKRIWRCANKDTGETLKTYIPSTAKFLVYNKLSRHILAIDCTGTIKKVSVLASEPNEDEGVAIFDEVGSWDCSIIVGTINTSYYAPFVYQSAYHTYFCVRGGANDAFVLYRVNADDTFEVVNAYTANVDAEGKVAYETDANGDALAFENCVVTKRPDTTEGEAIPFAKKVTRDGKTAWALMPKIFAIDAKSFILTNGIDLYFILPDGRCVEWCSLGTYWAWYRPDLWKGKPVTRPVISLNSEQGDALLPIGAFRDYGGSNGRVIFQALAKKTCPSADVFPLRNTSLMFGDGSTKLLEQKAVHSVTPLIYNDYAQAMPKQSAWGIVGVPSHLIRKDFS